MPGSGLKWIRPLDWQLVFYQYSEQFEVKSSDLNLKLKNQTFKFPNKFAFILSITEEFHHFDWDLLNEKKWSKELQRQSDHEIIKALCLISPLWFIFVSADDAEL